jgi:hypothetical protein
VTFILGIKANFVALIPNCELKPKRHICGSGDLVLSFNMRWVLVYPDCMVHFCIRINGEYDSSPFNVLDGQQT